MYTQMGRRHKSSITILQPVRESLKDLEDFISCLGITISSKSLSLSTQTHIISEVQAYQSSIKGHTCPFSVPGTSVKTQSKKRAVIIIHDRNSLSEAEGLRRSVRREVLSVKL